MHLGRHGGLETSQGAREGVEDPRGVRGFPVRQDEEAAGGGGDEVVVTEERQPPAEEAAGGGVHEEAGVASSRRRRARRARSTGWGGSARRGWSWGRRWRSASLGRRRAGPCSIVEVVGGEEAVSDAVHEVRRERGPAALRHCRGLRSQLAQERMEDYCLLERFVVWVEQCNERWQHRSDATGLINRGARRGRGFESFGTWSV